MNKYLQVARNTIDEYLTYRLNFIMWRVRSVLRILIVYFLWSSIFSSHQKILGYEKSQMLTYIVGISIIWALVFATRTQDIATDINEGKLSNYLLQPMSYFNFLLGRDLADKLFNLGFALIELTLLVIILKPAIFLQTNLIILCLTLASLIVSNALYILISILLGFIAFWSPETWGPRFLFFMVLDFFAGSFFPLDILPPAFYIIIQFSPLSYLIFFPMKIYLGQLTSSQITTGFGISIAWVLVLSLLARNVWKIGLRSYTAVGR